MKIGIIGGNGVAATNKLCEIIENKITKDRAIRDCDHPEIIIWQATQAPSRSMYLEGRGPSFLDDYIEIGKKLKFCGCDILCMCCNTAHFFINELEKQIELPFINIISEVVIKAKALNKQKLGVMASDGCCKERLYNKYFSKILPEAEIIYPDDEFQKLVTKGICKKKNKNRFTDTNNQDNPTFLFEMVRQHLINKGAETIILGCTDIRVAYNHPNCIDSLEVLADKLISLAHTK